MSALSVTLCGERVGLELERVALGPGVAAGACDGHCVAGVIQYLGGGQVSAR